MSPSRLRGRAKSPHVVIVCLQQPFEMPTTLQSLKGQIPIRICLYLCGFLELLTFLVACLWHNMTFGLQLGNRFMAFRL